MQHFLRRFSWLAAALVLQLAIYPSSVAFAKNSQVSQNSNKSFRVAVLELHDGQVKAEVVEKVCDTFRDQISSAANFSVLPKTQVESFFRSHPDWRTKQGTNSLTRYLDQAREFYKNVDFKNGIAVLENVIDTYRRAQPAMVENFPLVDAYLLLGNIQMGAKKIKDADQSFREAVRLDPEREITEEHYPPRTVSQFSQSKEEFLRKAKPSRLEIFSSPDKAEVYLNGVYKGVTPLKLDSFSTGEHFVMVQGKGVQPQVKRVIVKEQYARERFTLENKNVRGIELTRGVLVQDLSDVSEQVQLASTIGTQLGVDKVIWISVQELGYNHKINARMIDMQYQASYKQKSVEVLDLPKDTRQAAQVIVKDLSGMAGLDLAKDPKKYADSDVMVIGKKKRKSIWKSPILWGAIGAVVVGGATGAFLIGRGGGDDAAENTSSSVSLTGAAGSRP